MTKPYAPRAAAPDYLLTALLLLIVLFLSASFFGCAAHKDSNIDPDRVFQYGLLQREGDRFVLVEQSLESSDEIRDLLVMPDVPDGKKVCFELATKNHQERCVTWGEIRAWVTGARVTLAQP